MPTSDGADEEVAIVIRVPRSALTSVAPVPATVTQHTVEQHFGIPKRAYTRLLKSGLVPFKNIGRLKVASYEDVRRAVTEGALVSRRESSSAPNTGALTIDEFLKLVHARFLARARRPMTDDELDYAELWTDVSEFLTTAGTNYKQAADAVAARVAGRIGDEPAFYARWRSVGIDPVAMEQKAQALRQELHAEHPEMTWRERVRAVDQMWSAISEPLYEAQRRERAEKRAAKKAERVRLGQLEVKR